MASSIAVIVPTYNRASLLRECLSGILELSRPPQQIIVVNDGSTDDTQSVVRACGSQVTLLNKENGGKSEAINLGLAHCCCDYIALCDDDDVMAPEGLEKLAAALDADPSADFAYGDYWLFHNQLQNGLEIPPNSKRTEEPNLTLNFLEGMFTQFNALLVRRRAYKKAGLFNTELRRSQDYDMVLRLSRFGKGVYVPTVVFYMRKHNGIRGAGPHAFTHDESENQWLRYDQKILAKVRQDYALAEFTPTFARELAPLRAMRGALLERAHIFARRAVWSVVAEDLASAARLADAPPSADEVALAERISAIDLSLNALQRDDILALRETYEINAFSRAIIKAAFGSMTWRARLLAEKGEIGSSFRKLHLLFGVFGMRDGARNIWQAINS